MTGGFKPEDHPRDRSGRFTTKSRPSLPPVPQPGAGPRDRSERKRLHTALTARQTLREARVITTAAEHQAQRAADEISGRCQQPHRRPLAELRRLTRRAGALLDRIVGR